MQIDKNPEIYVKLVKYAKYTSYIIVYEYIIVRVLGIPDSAYYGYNYRL